MIIKIFGGKSEGKTTMATWLARELEKLGVEVECEDQVALSEAQLKERLEAMTKPQDRLKVALKTVSYGGETLPAYAKKFQEKTNT